jgi:hypothetical protein
MIPFSLGRRPQFRVYPGPAILRRRVYIRRLRARNSIGHAVALRVRVPVIR